MHAWNDPARQEMVALLPRLRRFACSLTGSNDGGDDLVQSTCERALSRLHLWEPGTRLDRWMFRILRNLWFDDLRAGRRCEVATSNEILDKFAGGDSEAELVARLELGAVRELIGRLPAEQRAVLMLVSVEGLSYREAATALDVPIGTVMSRLARARLALGRALEPSRPEAVP